MLEGTTGISYRYCTKRK